MSFQDTRVVIGIDFGTTYSGFAYCHTHTASGKDIKDIDIRTNTSWPGEIGSFKTNTVLQYDPGFENVVKWGNPALSKQPDRRNKNKSATRPVELFKLCLGKLQDDLKPKLPVEYEKAIADYLRKLGERIKEEVKWDTENVLLVLTVPAEYSEKEQAIMRKCALKANLIKDKRSKKLRFTTEPEAAAIYCMETKLQEYDLLTIGTTFMIVDCGGGTVDLTTRKLVGDKQLGEVTERTGDFCGSTFIDKEFVKFLRKKLGTRAIDLLIENHYDQYQYLIQEFCRRVKIPFTGNNSGFHHELDIDENAPALLQYVSKEIKEIMEENDWLVDIKYNDIKNMFDPIVERIIRMIDIQLFNSQKNREACSAIFLVGGFSESVYLRKEIKKLEPQHSVKVISVNQPIAAIVRGAAMYGLSLKNSFNAGKMLNRKRPVISTRVLKFTYGIKSLKKWNKEHPPDRRVYGDRIYLFDPFVGRGDKVDVDNSFTKSGFTSLDPNQKTLKFELFKTPEYEDDAKYHNEMGMKLVGTLRIFLPEPPNKITFGFSFGEMEIAAFAKNESDGQNVQTTFELSSTDFTDKDLEDFET